MVAIIALLLNNGGGDSGGDGDGGDGGDGGGSDVMIGGDGT